MASPLIRCSVARGAAPLLQATRAPRPRFDAPIARVSPSSSSGGGRCISISSSRARRRTGGSGERRNQNLKPAAATSTTSAGGDDSPDSSSPPSSYQSLKTKLGAYGVAGVVAYGILNTLYYTVAFAAAWFFLQERPAAGQGWAGALKAAGLVMAGTWVGSQATKIARALGAVALAPWVDGLLDAAGRRLGGKRRAAAAVVAGCLCAWAAVVVGILASVA